MIRFAHRCNLHTRASHCRRHYFFGDDDGEGRATSLATCSSSLTAIWEAAVTTICGFSLWVEILPETEIVLPSYCLTSPTAAASREGMKMVNASRSRLPRLMKTLPPLAVFTRSALSVTI